MQTDLIVAVYKENLNWLKSRENPFETIYAYGKFHREDYKFVEYLPNIGRESHTYIWHILKNYEKIESDYLMFLQGMPLAHIQAKIDSIGYSIFNNKYNLIHLFYPLGNCVLCDGRSQPFSPEDCKLYLFWDELFGYDMPENFIANHGAQMIVHKSLILNRSKKFWEKALELHYSYDIAPWAFEILWNNIFDPRCVSIN